MAKETGPDAGKGFWGRILFVNLSTGKLDYEDVPDDLYRQYLSGVGLGARVLWERLKPGVDPLGPENILGFTTGLLTDTPTLFTGRFTVVGKSPLSGGWGDSNCGGYFAPALKKCGVDAVFFTGRSDEPVYLYLDGENDRLEGAGDLWGSDIVETEAKLKALHGKRAQVAVIGEAGEKLSRMAGICNDGGRIAARSGLGGVMGSKNLKAVVAAGKKKVGVVDKDGMRELTRQYKKRIDGMRFMEKPLGDMLLGMTGLITRMFPVYPRQPADLWRAMLRKFGTPALTAMSAEMGDSPVKNWGGVGKDDFPLKRSQRIGAEAVCGYETKKYGCHACPVRCGGIVSIKEGPYPIEETHKPEYESICAFGTMILNDDLYSIFKVNDMCNRAGIDTISCGATVAFAVECFENGILTPEDTDGLMLRWGNSEAIVALTEKIIRREGIGDLLADGVKVASEKLGERCRPYAVHVGGVEPPMHDPKFDPGYGMIYQVEAAPGRHTVASCTYIDLQFLERKFSRAEKPKPFFTDKHKYRYDDKGNAIAVDTFYKMIIDSFGLCLFGTQVGGDMPVCEWANLATGWYLTPDEYLEAGERIEHLRHCFNLREGIDARRDVEMHPRMTGRPPQKSGPLKGVTLDTDTMVRTFYEALHWDTETGLPSRAHMEKLGMADVLDDLEKPPKKPARTPAGKAAAPGKKAPAKKAPVKKEAREAGKTTAKKPAAKKAAAKKPAGEKGATAEDTKKAATKTSTAKTSKAKKSSPSGKSDTAKKSSTAKKKTTDKSTAKKSGAAAKKAGADKGEGDTKE
ncbi:MAG: aldehyde ferredoxin oxidoreductase family protein [Desulfatibacillaceae bacterium]